MKPILAVYIQALKGVAPAPRLWPPNPQRLPAKTIHIPPPTRAAKWN